MQQRREKEVHESGSQLESVEAETEQEENQEGMEVEESRAKEKEGILSWGGDLDVCYNGLLV